MIYLTGFTGACRWCDLVQHRDAMGGQSYRHHQPNICTRGRTLIFILWPWHLYCDLDIYAMTLTFNSVEVKFTSIWNFSLYSIYDVPLICLQEKCNAIIEMMKWVPIPWSREIDKLINAGLDLNHPKYGYYSYLLYMVTDYFSVDLGIKQYVCLGRE